MDICEKAFQRKEKADDLGRNVAGVLENNDSVAGVE